ncbi:hypothetical protein [Ancylobacter terrae]|uniref:hypothetical protein n=1 Tax=Ancylobacter sp. sgz301288 TaxID=3342077 RepID=UPI00385C0C85
MASSKPVTPPTQVEAKAQAALMLVESLALSLVEQGVLTREEVVEVIENVIETKRRMGEESEDPEVAHAAAGMLSVIANSVRAAHSAPPVGRDDEK